ncbi:hypothetical protein [Nakamurella aerolata]|uniref:MFS transporter n=1 Tax=Nakamurella aerolata TaxID=1656892 RepID=A0A849ADV1_9ACTN|nr:hypothetical protein [Nakamurella aerolata]NNG35052.1 hypothetical protein [Nakamurella aerolata]
MLAIHRSAVVIAAIVFLFGVAAFSISAALSGRVFALAGDAPTLASGVNISMLNLGNAIGPAVAGALITAQPEHYPLAPLCSLAFLGLALAGVAAAALLERSRLSERPRSRNQWRRTGRHLPDAERVVELGFRCVDRVTPRWTK